MHLRGVLALAVLGVLSPIGSAQVPPETPAQAANEALAAFRTGDAEALKTLAGRDEPDPWLVADELCANGERDAAVAFATAAPRRDTERLPEYLEGRRGAAPDAEARKTIAAARSAFLEGNHDRALELLTPTPIVESTLTLARRHLARGRALRELRRLEESAAAFDASAEAAREIGWLRREALALHEAASSAYGRSDLPAALARFSRLCTLSEQRGDRVGVARALANLGTVHQSLGDTAKALSCEEKSLQLCEENGDALGAAAALGALGLIHDTLGDYTKALTYQERSLAAYEELGDLQGVASALGDIGSQHYRRGDLTRALLYYERSLSLCEQLRDRSGIARTLGNIGNVWWKRSEYEKALSYQKRSLVLREELGDRIGAAATLGNIGLIHECRGEYVAALTCQERSLAICEEIGDRAGMAAALGSIGSIHMARGDFARAGACQERSLRLSEEIGDRARVASMLANIGGRYAAIGDFATALIWQERAFSLSEELGDRPGVALLLAHIGSTHLGLGDCPKALSHLERALELMQNLGDRAGTASVLGNIGTVEKNLGDYAKALSCLERSLAMREELGDRPGVASALVSLGNVYDRLGDYQKALTLEERAQKLQEELGNRLGAAAVLGNIGNILGSLGDLPRAVGCLQRSIELLEQLGDRAGVARTLANLGSIACRLGDFETALSCLRRSLEMSEEQGNRPGAAATLLGIGLAYEGLGDLPNALSFLERAARELQRLRRASEQVSALAALSRVRLAAGDSGRALVTAKQGTMILERVLAGLGELDASSVRGVHASVFAVGALAAARLGETAEVAGFIESGRAGALLETLGGRQAVSWRDVPPELQRCQAEARSREVRANADYALALESGDHPRIGRARKALEEAIDLECEVVSRIQREAKRAAGLFYPRAATMEEIQGWLEPGEVLVLYGLCLDEALALVLTPDSDRIVPLGKTAGIADGDYAALRTRLAKPLALPEGTATVLVSPEGPLCYVPWAAVFDRPVACVPSGTTLVLLREEQREPGSQVLALGDPDYGNPDAGAVAVYRAGGPLAALPATGEEAQAVGDVVLLGTDASEPGLAAALSKQKRWRAVHLACHGLVKPEKPALSSLVLSRAGDSDGFLTCLEVLQMQIPADLAVLSACETAKGKIVQGEGIVGLTRAFMYAGAPRVLCSLWKVDDEATKALMVKFYELWNPEAGPGLPAAAALRGAQDFVRSQEQWKDPRYWAAWVLWGLAD